MNAKYLVMNENTLGYLIDGRFPQLGVLACIKGGHDWKNGSVMIGCSPVRPATAEDFNHFRVHVPSDHSEFDQAEWDKFLARHHELWSR
jgi:hypothetical protein